MKKYVLILLYIAVVISLFANNQKVIPLGSEIYNYIEIIAYESGISLLSSAKPYTEAEIENILNEIDLDNLSDTGKNTYQIIKDKLEPKPVYKESGFSLDLTSRISLEAYLHTSEDTSQWEYDYESRLPIFSIDAEATFNESFYAVISPQLKESRFLLGRKNEQDSFIQNYTNIPLSFAEFNYHFPERGLFSSGGENWSFIVGRDSLEYGNGNSGKLLLSSYSDYYDFIRLKGFVDNFAFTWTYTNLENWKETNSQRYIVDHVLEARFFDKLTLYVNEAALFYGESTELQFINPLIIYHNLFRNHFVDGTGANICMTTGFNFVPVTGLQIYGEYLLDEIQTNLEQTEYGSGVNTIPNANAYLFGGSATYSVGPGFITGFFEYVYTSPWCYLLEPSGGALIWSHLETTDVLKNKINVYKPLGYEYGPDTIAFAAQVGYMVPGLFKAALTADYILKGENDINTEYQETLEAAKLTTPTGVPEKKLAIGINGEYDILSFLSAGIDLAYVNITNFNHSDATVFNDFQAAFTITATISNETFF